MNITTIITIMQFNKTEKFTLEGRQFNEEKYINILKHCVQENMKPQEYFKYMDDFDNKSYDALKEEHKIVFRQLEKVREERSILLEQLHDMKYNVDNTLQEEIDKLENNNKQVVEVLNKLQSNNYEYCTIA